MERIPMATKPFDAETDRFILNKKAEGWSFQKIAFRIGRAPTTVTTRYHNLISAGVNTDTHRHLHRLAVGFLK